MRKVEFSIQVVSPAVMRRLNRTYRGKDKPTDVLSFPLWTKHELSTLREKHDILDLGDIFINRVDAKGKLAFLVVHGFLHLMGYDHERSKREAQKVEQLEKAILTSRDDESR